MAENVGKRVFISYSRFDYLDSNKQVIPGNTISKIMDAFNNVGISYWIDEKGIYSGDEFVPLISKAIKACDIFLFISSKASNASDWTSNEIAAANMYKKKIIPFRLDDSTYNDSIIMFIAKLDYIDYNANPENAISRLVSSVLEYLQALDSERERKEKEKEFEKKKREQQQKKIISDIEISAAELDNDERGAEIKRRYLINSVQNVEDEKERNRLLELIDNSGPLYKKHKDDVLALTHKLDEKEKVSYGVSQSELEEKEKLIEEKEDEITKCRETIEVLELQIEKKDKDFSKSQETISIQENLIEQRDKEISLCKNKIKDQEKQINQKDSEICKIQDKYRALEYSIKQKENVISENKETIRKQEKLIAKLNQEINSRVQLLNCKDNEISELQKIIEEHDKRYAEIKQQLKNNGYVLIFLLIIAIVGWAFWAFSPSMTNRVEYEEDAVAVYDDSLAAYDDALTAYDDAIVDSFACDSACWEDE